MSSLSRAAGEGWEGASPMNIHEYQAKELLKRYGVAVPDGYVAWTPDEAVGRRPQTSRPGLRGEVADPRRRPRRRPFRRRPERQGRRPPRPLRRRGARRRRGHDRPHAGHQADRPRRPRGAPRLCRGRLRHRPRTLSVAAGRPRQRPRHHRRLHRRRHGDRGGRRNTTGEDPARRDRPRLRHLRRSMRAGSPTRWASPAIRSPRSAASCPGCIAPSPRSTAPSSRSIRWW